MVEVKIWLEPSQSNFGAFLFHARAKLTQVLLFGAFSEYVGALSNRSKCMPFSREEMLQSKRNPLTNFSQYSLFKFLVF